MLVFKRLIESNAWAFLPILVKLKSEKNEKLKSTLKIPNSNLYLNLQYTSIAIAQALTNY